MCVIQTRKHKASVRDSGGLCGFWRSCVQWSWEWVSRAAEWASQ